MKGKFLITVSLLVFVIPLSGQRTVAHWKFTPEHTSGSIRDGDLVITDQSGSNNDLYFKPVTQDIYGYAIDVTDVSTLSEAQKDRLEEMFTWQNEVYGTENSQSLLFNTGARNWSDLGGYFETAADAPLNETYFGDQDPDNVGFTIEVIFKMPSNFTSDQHRWTSILSREGSADQYHEAVNEGIISDPDFTYGLISSGESELLHGLSISSLKEMQWFYWLSRPYETHWTNVKQQTNWSFTLSDLDDWYHVVLVNDGTNSEIYINGVTDFRNATTEDVDESAPMLPSLDGYGWLVGATGYYESDSDGDGVGEFPLSKLFDGTIQEMRFTVGALEQDDWLYAEEESDDQTDVGTNETIDLLSDDDNYNIVFVPDTQKPIRYMPEIVDAQMEWLANHSEENNIVFTQFVGDLVDQWNDQDEWDAIFNSLDYLNDADIPFMTADGNHDGYDGASPDDSQLSYIQFFNSDYYSDKDYYLAGGEESPSGYASYSIIRGKGDYTYMFLTVSHFITNYHLDFDWVNEVLEKYSYLPTFFITHEHLAFEEDGSGTYRVNDKDVEDEGFDPEIDDLSSLYDTYKLVWQRVLRSNNNIFMTMCGHNHGAGYQISSNEDGNAIFEGVYDYQSDYHGGNGWMNFLEFDEDGNKISFRVFSPWVDQINEEDRTYYDVKHRTTADEYFDYDINFSERFDFYPTLTLESSDGNTAVVSAENLDAIQGTYYVAVYPEGAAMEEENEIDATAITNANGQYELALSDAGDCIVVLRVEDLYVPISNELAIDQSPGVSITSTNYDPSASSSVEVTVTFSEEVSGFEEDEIIITNGTISNFATSDNTLFTFSVMPNSIDVVTVNIPQAVATDLTGHDNAASDEFSIVPHQSDEVIAHWKFTPEYTSGSIRDGDLKIIDISNNSNDLYFQPVSKNTNGEAEWITTLTNDQKDLLEQQFTWVDDVLGDENEQSLLFETGANNWDGIGAYFVTAEDASLNETYFGDDDPDNVGYTIELVFKLPSDFTSADHEGTNVFSREGAAAQYIEANPDFPYGLLASSGDVNVLHGLSISGTQELNWYYWMSRPFESHWNNVRSQSSTSDALSNLDDWYHVALINDGTATEVYINGVTGTGNASNNAIDPSAPMLPGLDGYGWLVGASGYYSADSDGDGIGEFPITSLFDGTIQEMRFTVGALDSEDWLYTDLTKPSVSISSSASDPSYSESFEVTITFSEEVNGFTEGDVTIGNGAISDFATSDNIEFTFNLTPESEGDVTVDIAEAVATDLFGNENTASTQFSIEFTYDYNIWDGSTWSKGTPSSDNAVRFDADYDFETNGSLLVEVLTISSGVTVTVQPSTYLEVSDNVIVYGELVVESGGSFIHYSTANVSGASHITVKRNPSHGSSDKSTGKYSFFGSPVQQSNENTASDLGDLVYRFDESLDDDAIAGYVTVSGSTELAPGVGYASAFSEESVAFTGEPNSGTVLIPVTATTNGYNLIANPYSAAIDVDEFLVDNASVAFISIWDDGGGNVDGIQTGSYIQVNSLGEVTATSHLNENTFEGNITSAQGFFVSVNAAGDIEFSESQRVVDGNEDTHFFRQSNEEGLSSLKMSLGAEGYFWKEALFMVHSDATEEVDLQKDAELHRSGYPVELFTLIESSAYAIQAVAPQEQMNVPLGYTVSDAGQYELKVVELKSFDAYQLVLLDHQEGVSAEITEDFVYSFESPSGTFAGRFEIVAMQQKVLSVSSALGEEIKIEPTLGGVKVISNSLEKATISIYQVNGQSVVEQEVTFALGEAYLEVALSRNVIYAIRVNGIDQKFILTGE